MDTILSVIGGVVDTATSIVPIPSQQPINHGISKRQLLLRKILMFIAVLFLIYIVYSYGSHAAARSDPQVIVSVNDQQLNLLVASINNIGLRVSSLDKLPYTSINTPTSWTTTVVTNSPSTNMDMSISIPIKSSFTPTNYLTELELFKGMSPTEQAAYMGMTKTDKKAKYGSHI